MDAEAITKALKEAEALGGEIGADTTALRACVENIEAALAALGEHTGIKYAGEPWEAYDAVGYTGYLRLRLSSSRDGQGRRKWTLWVDDCVSSSGEPPTEDMWEYSQTITHPHALGRRLLLQVVDHIPEFIRGYVDRLRTWHARTRRAREAAETIAAALGQ